MVTKNSQDMELIKKDLNIIKDKLNLRENVERLNVRLSVIENLIKMGKKRGQIDPRWILIIIIIVLFILYLKSKGYNWFG